MTNKKSCEKKRFTYCVIYVYKESEGSKKNLQLFLDNGVLEKDDIFYTFAINGKTLSAPIPKSQNIKIIKRENIGHDFGAWKECLAALEAENMIFDRYIFMNDTVAGPFLPRYIKSKRWYKMFCRLLSSKVKLSGLSINSDPWNLGKPDMQHVQSMMFCTDRIGLKILKKKIFCHDAIEFQKIYNNGRKDFIVKFEIGMSKAILEQGYRIAALYIADKLKNKTGDIWGDGKYFGTTMNPFETMFIKANRISSPVIDLYTDSLR